jgi:vacuolar-type H+-ATPase subunit H
VNLVLNNTFPSPRTISRQGAPHAVPHSLTVACTHSSSPYSPLTSITPVLADLSLIPNKYHVFINPPLRRVYLEDRADHSKAVINELKSKIVFLEARVELLKSDNVCMERECRLTLDKAKEDAQLALDEARKDARIDLDKAKADAQVALDEVNHEARLAQAKTNKEARLALDKANKGLHIANLGLKELRHKHDELKSR